MKISIDNSSIYIIQKWYIRNIDWRGDWFDGMSTRIGLLYAEKFRNIYIFIFCQDDF